MSGTSLISETTAKQMMDFIFRHAEDCNDLLLHLQPQVSPEEFRQCKFIIGSIMAALHDEGLRPIFKRHPHLKPPDFP